MRRCIPRSRWYHAFALLCAPAMTGCISQFNTQFIDPSESSVQVTPPSLPADGTTQAAVRVDLFFAKGAPAEGITVVWTTTGTPVTVDETSAVTDATGTAIFHVHGTEPGNANIAFFASLPSERLNLRLQAAIALVPPAENQAEAVALQLLGYPASTVAGNANDVMLVAVDANGRISKGYAGLVALRTDDANAVLPATIDFDAAAGPRALSVAFHLAGSRYIAAEDTTGTLGPGRQDAIMVAPAAAATLRVACSPNAFVATVAGHCTVTAFDLYDNVATGYTGRVALTSTAPDQAALGNVVFDANARGAVTQAVVWPSPGTFVVTAQDSGRPELHGSGQVTVQAPLPTARLTLAYPSRVVAGVGHPAVVTAWDTSGAIATAYRGTVALSSLDPNVATQTVVFDANDAGAHTFALALVTAGTWDVDANDIANPALFATQQNVVVDAGDVNRLSVAGYPSPVTAGTTAPVTVVALDAFDNIIYGYTGMVQVRTDAPNATLPPAYTYGFSDSGSHAFDAQITSAGTWSLVANDLMRPDVAGVQTSVVVDPDAVVRLRVSGYPSPTAVATHGNVIVSAVDVYDNPVPSYTGRVLVTATDANAQVPPAYTFGPSDDGVHAFDVVFQTPGTRALDANDTVDSTLFGEQPNILVAPGPAVALRVYGYPSPAFPGTLAGVFVEALDAWGNFATGYRGTVHMSATDPMAQLPADHTYLSGDQGRYSFPVRLMSGGIWRIDANDTVSGGIAGNEPNIIVSPNAAVRFTVTGYPSPIVAGTTATVTVTAYDNNNAVATGYTGTVTMSTSDPNAVLPPSHTFTLGDAGVFVFGVGLRTAGIQALNANDTATPAIAGAQTGIQVNPNVTTALRLSGFPATIGAGVQGSLTIVAMDAYSNTTPSYTGSVHVSATDPAFAPPGDVVFDANDQGVHTVAAVLTTTGTWSLIGNDTVTPAIAGRQRNIVVNPGPAVGLGVSGLTTPRGAGVQGNITVVALDAYGNTVTGYAGQVALRSADAQAQLPGPYTFTGADAGVAILPVTLNTAGTWWVDANDLASPSIAGAEPNIVVTPGVATHLTVTGYANPTVAGAAHQVTVTAYDASNNIATGYTGTVHVTSTDPCAGLPADTTFVAGDMGSRALPVTLATVGTQAIQANDTLAPTLAARQTGVVVQAGAAIRLAVTGYPASTTAGAVHLATVTAYDANNNVAAGYAGTVHLTSSDGAALLPADYAFATGDAGIRAFPIALATAGNQSLGANDTLAPSVAGMQAPIAVQPGGAVALSVAGYPNPTSAGTSHPLVITAYDANHNVATGYAGTVHLVSTDPAAALASDYTFLPADQGTHSLAVTLATTGTQAIDANDVHVPSIGGGQSGIVVDPAAAARLVIANYPTTTVAGAAHALTVTAVDANGNVATGYTGTVHISSTDGNGLMPGDYSFVPGDAGVHVFSATLATVGLQSLSGNDTGTASIAGTQSGVTVVAGSATHFTVTGFVNPTRAGVSHNVLVTAYDANNNVASGYTGTVHLTSSDPNAVLAPDYTLVAADGGTHAFAVTLQHAGTQNIGANDTVSPGIAGTQTGIVVTADDAVRLACTGYPNPTVAGAAHPVTITAYDVYDNVAAGYTGTVHLSSSDAGAALPSDYTFLPADNGTHALSLTLVNVGTQSIQANDTVTPAIAGNQNGIVVNAGGAVRLAVSGFSNPTLAGAVHSVTVTALDANNNVATGYTGTVHFTSSDGGAGLPANYPYVSGDGGVHTFSAALATQGVQSIQANDTITPSIAGAQLSIAVNPGAAVRLAVSGFASPTLAGAPHAFNVVAYDANNNVATGYTGTVTISSSDSNANKPPNYTFVAGDHGTHSLTAALATVGTQSLSANDVATLGVAGAQTGLVVNAGLAVRLAVTGYANPTVAGVAHSATVTAYDANNNVASGYTGTVHITSSDAAAVPPADTTFVSGDAGVRALSVVLKTAGTQSVQANDTVTTGIAGSQTGIVVVPAATARLRVTGYPSPTVASTVAVVSVVAQDAYGNTTPSYAGDVHISSTDVSATLPGDYNYLAADNGVHGFSVTLNSSGTWNINANDTVAPSIAGSQGNIVISPNAAVRFVVTGYPNPAVAGTQGNVTVTAYDNSNNVAIAYTGTVSLSSTDAGAQLPASHTYVSADNGTYTFPVRLTTAGTWAINANDTVTPALSGRQSGTVVTPNSITHFAVAGFPNPVTAGVQGNVTVTAKDAYGNTATAYTGTVHFTSTDPSPVLPVDTAFAPGDNGVKIFPATLTVTGTRAINVNDTTTAAWAGGQTGIVVNPGPAVRLGGLGFTNPTVAGATHNVIITAYDANNNVATGYTGTVHVASSDGAATTPADYTFASGDHGAHSFAVTLATVGTQSINANDTGTPAVGGGQAGIVVQSGTAVRLTVTGYANPTVAGAAHNLTVTAYDANNNVATGYTGTVHIATSDLAAGTPADYAFVSGDLGVHALSLRFATAGTQSINANDTVTTSIAGTQSGIVVNPGAATRLAVTGYVNPTVAGASHSVLLTAYDANNNVATGYTGTVHLTSSDTAASTPGDYTFVSGDHGTHALAVALATVGTWSINANDTVTASVAGNQTGIVVNPGAAVRLAGTSFSNPTVAGAVHSLTITAYDANNNVATGYAGTVHLSSSDGAAGLPANYTFVSGDHGAHTFSASLATVGTQSLNANDVTTPAIGGGQAGIVVNPGSAVRLGLSGFANPTVAGAAHSVTVTAYDANNNVATGYTGTVHVTSSDSGATLPGNYTFLSADAGIHALSVTLATAGTQSINANDTVTASIGGGQTGIVVGPGAAVRLTVAGFPNPTAAGAAHNVTITAYDANNNVATGYTGTVHVTSSDSSALLPANYPFLAGDAGVHALSVTLASAGTQSINANDTVTAGIGGGQTGVVVNAGTAVRFSVAGYANPTVAGAAHNVTVTAYDANNNIATGYAGMVHLTSSDGAAALPANYQYVSGDNGAHAFSVSLATVGTRSISANDTTTPAIAGLQSGIVVNSGSAVRLTGSGYTNPTVAGASHNITVTAYDANNNIATGYTGTVHITSSDGSALTPANYAYTGADAGAHVFAVSLATVGTQTINANDTVTASIGGGQTGIVVNPGSAVRLAATGYTNPTVAGVAHNVTITAYDANNNIATGYTGTVHITSSDGSAVTPSNYTFSSGDNGTHALSVTLATAGTRSISANDTVTASIAGAQTGIVVNAGAAVRFTVAGYTNPTVAGAAHTVTVTAYDANNNVATGYTGTVRLTSGDASAGLPSNYTFLAGDSGTHGLSVALATVGTQNINANDTVTASISGAQTGIVVNPGAAVRLGGAGFANPTVAGVAHNVTITAYDANNNVATGYTGTVHITSTDPCAVNPNNYTFVSGDSGTHVLSEKLVTSGTQSINANDTLTASIGGGQAGIVVNAASTVRFNVTAYPNPTVAGAQGNVIVAAVDIYNNITPAYAGTAHFTSSDTNAQLPANLTYTGTQAGVAAFPVTLKTSGTQAINVNDTVTASIAGSQAVLVNPNVAYYYKLTGYTTPVVAGTLGSMTVTVYDYYNNVATGYTGIAHFTSSDAQATLPPDYTFVSGDAGAHTFTNLVALKTVGSKTISASEASTGRYTSTLTFTVTPASTSKFIVTPPASVTAGSAFSATVTASDAYGNTTPSYTGTMTFFANDYQFPTLPGNYTFLAGDNGVKTFTNGFTLKTGVNRYIKATDTTTSSITGSANTTVNSTGTVTRLQVSPPTVVVQNVNNTIIVAGVDTYGNTVSSYSGSISLASTDASGAPKSGTPLALTASGGNVAVPNVHFTTTGYQRLTATDSAHSLNGNTRYLVNKLANFTTGQAATIAIGQPNLNSNSPVLSQNGQGSEFGPYVSPEGVLFTSDFYWGRTEAYTTFPTANQPNATFVIGQPDFVTSATTASATGFVAPTDISDDGGLGAFVADIGSNRVLHYSARPSAFNAAADFVVGQPNMTSTGSNCTANTLQGPFSVLTVPQYNILLVADMYNHRVLVYTPMIPTSNQPTATLAFGAPDMVTCSNSQTGPMWLDTPRGLISNGVWLAISDSGNNRILIFNSIQSLLNDNINGPSADVVLGQADLYSYHAYVPSTSASISTTHDVGTDGSQLFGVDAGYSRVLLWNSIPTTNNAAASAELFAPSFTAGAPGGTCSSTLDGGSVTGVFYYKDKLVVTAYGNHRSVVFQSN